MRWPLTPVLLLCLALQSSVAAADPRSHYMIHCMGCHLADGSGLPPDVPVFDEKLTLFAASEKGREYLVRVPGASQAHIDDDALAAVLNWILDEYAGDETEHKPFLASEVSLHRHKPLTNPAVLRDELLGVAD